MAFLSDQAYEHVARAFANGRLAHALLISGPRDCGKSTLAAKISWLLQGKANAGVDLFGDPVVSDPLPLDEQECDAVQVLRPEKKSRIIDVDSIRDAENRLHKAVSQDTWKIVVISDCDRMNQQAQNAFLKTLEEPPNNTVLMLLTSQPQALLPTILSRCVQLPLMGKTNYKANGGDELIDTLNRVASASFGTPWGALTIKNCFTDVLDQRKEQIEDAEDILYSNEKKQYAQTTDGSWLKEREEFHEAAKKSAYLAERSRFFDIMMAWMADALRCQAGAPCEDFPEVESLISQLAASETTASLLRRVEALEDLRATLETNASEQLAIECGFLKAFGATR
jgi:DNA polymerase-3 subunit delta'